MSALEQSRRQTRPANVKTAVQLLFASFAISCLLGVLDSFLSGDLFSLSGLFGLIFAYGLYWALITLIARGHKKAFIAYYCILALSILLEFYAPIQDTSTLQNSWFVQLLSVSSTIMDLIALYLLLQKPSLAWLTPVTERSG